MSSPIERVLVQCPNCWAYYDDSYRRSFEASMTDKYAQEMSAGTCPNCGSTSDIGDLIAKGAAWVRDPDRAEVFISPKWPDGKFRLLALVLEPGEAPWDVGPFERADFESDGRGEGGLVVSYPMDRPFQLRVTSQDGDVIEANNGDMGPMSYLIVPCLG